ncbi:hypothetical protein CN360_30830 [Bacillus cereus]|uniref:hypothetical protein n=1 Tax=Bacillus cereus group TaxID=86661 RepID=UPI0005393BE0|nr:MULTISPECIES: hypothetical protein [Bacillus cereus group]EKS7870743.1 hypothetical protein [Bacillus cereus]PDY15843.1 hypothetical protein COM76_27225 [Bacillus cereus]PEC01237.1 hypothetical protein COM98_30530 [Bacillus cereus]PET55543.1 hypothetical protein CN522_30890 [Bacillus cereus]PEU49817.1 hypothetical protein CN414_30745 [Bacillus cereus]
MFNNLGISFLWLLLAYGVATLTVFIHMLISNKYFGVQNAKQAGTTFLKSPVYVKSRPYQVLYNVAIFPVFLWLYSKGIDTDNVKEFMLNTVIQWTALSIIIDYLSWVLIPHKFRLTHKEFYIDYQPYITLIYVAIFISHYIVGFFII